MRHDDKITYDGQNGFGVVAWARAKGEFNLQLFEGEPTLFLATGRVTLLPGESVLWSDTDKVLSIVPKFWLSTI